ncbi:MAG: hypothetical protein A2096_08295 [Spirochaetes bacterium GWF1_41_5]|nr:MAG: hypothetical protein A2096_08295 [Spirochaetes bacterium GWF1_41_5]HBE01927.1 hypothetical protein [Spirochaetia bacterium]
MICENVEMHNIAEVKKLWNGSLQMQRVPENVRKFLNEGAQLRSLSSANSEIRFICDSPRAKISLSSANGDDVFHVAYGNFISPASYPIIGSPITYEFEIPENIRCLKPGRHYAFDPRVFRILLPRKNIVFFKAEGENLRPPELSLLPKKRYLAYGTSITEGGAATRPHLAYAAQTARALGMDLINLGMSGSCHCEPEMAEYIAGRDDWDIATLCLSVNMMGDFTTDEFRKRVTYFVNTVAGSNIKRPVICITMFPYFVGLSSNHLKEEEKASAFRQILREAAAACPYKNVQAAEGPELLDTPDGLSFDLIHPNDYGMKRIAENLTLILKSLII